MDNKVQFSYCECGHTEQEGHTLTCVLKQVAKSRDNKQLPREQSNAVDVEFEEM